MSFLPLRTTSLAVALTAASVLAACSGHSSGLSRDSQYQEMRNAAHERQNDRLESRVEAALHSDYRIKSRKSLRVIAQGDGVVEIQGQIEGAGDKFQATETARRVPGVRQVLNNMTY